MPAKAPVAVGRAVGGNHFVAGCLALSALGFAGTVALALLPMVAAGKGAMMPPLPWLPPLAALLALGGGVLGAITAHRTAPASVTMAAIKGVELPKAALAGIQGIVHELGSLLVEERGKIATLQEICSAGMRDARTVSKRVENLTEAALDAETRLAAGVTRAAETAVHVAQALPEITEMVRRGIAEAISARMEAEVGGPFGTLRAAVTEAAGEMAELKDTAAAARRDMTALDAAGREIAVASATVIYRLGSVAGQIDSALAALPETAASVSAAAEHAAQVFSDVAAAVQAEESPWTVSRDELRAAAVELKASRDAAAAAGDKMVGLVHDGIDRIDGVLAGLPIAAAALTSTAAQACETLTGTTAVVRTGTADMAAQADAMRLTFRQGVEDLDTARQQLADATQQTTATAERAIDVAQGRLVSILRETEAAGAGMVRLTDVAAALESAADALANGACRLEAAGERMVATSGVALDAATASATRADLSAAAVDAVHNDIASLGGRLAAQIDRLGDIVGQAGLQAAGLPDVASRLEQVAEQITQQPAVASAEAVRAVLPEALAPLLNRIDDVRTGLAHVAALQRTGNDQEEALTTLAGLSADIGESVRRVQAALAHHDGIWPALQSSMSQVEAAAVAVVEAAANERMRPANPANEDSDGTPEQLAATLRRFDELDDQSRGLLQQAEALAEAVLAGRAPDLPSLLADRTPALLAGIEAATRRLRSVATALALASDGAATTRRSAETRPPDQARAGAA